MIYSLEGIILQKKEKFIVLSVNGIGFKVFLSKASLNRIPQVGQTLKLFTFLDFSENGFSLYGFLEEKELELFEFLNNISGIGAKASLEISSIGSIEKLHEKIQKEGKEVFKNIPGVGPKKIQKIIFEISGIIENVKKTENETDKEVIAGLSNLGFKKEEIKKALEKISKDIQDPEEKIKEVLKILGK